MTKIALYQRNDQLVTLSGLTDATNALVTGATITGTIVDGKGVAVTNGGLTFADLAGVPGSYQAFLPAAFNPAVATNYTLQLAGTKLGVTFNINIACTVAIRTL